MSDFRVIDWDALARLGGDFFKQGSAISIGGFDGLHLGHIALLEKLKKNANGMLKGVLSFYTPPAYMLSTSSKHGLISTLRLKKEKLIRLGLDFIILVDFSSKFAKMGAEDFVGGLKKYLNLEFLIVGTDFHFGYNRVSSIVDMQALSYKFFFTFEALQPLLIDGKSQKISSSDLRAYIYNGDVLYANSLLGEPFTVDLLNLTPCDVNEKEVKFRKEDIKQVLPRKGCFEGVVFFKTNLSKDRVVILIDDDYLRLVFENVKQSKEKPYFDILKFV